MAVPIFAGYTDGHCTIVSTDEKANVSKNTGNEIPGIEYLPVPVAQRMVYGAPPVRSIEDDTAASPPAASGDGRDNHAPPVPLPGPAASGPMSAPVTIPARPRPGRRPIQHADPADRRRVQNRVAQRNFRDRRQRRVEELEEELQTRRRDYENQLADLERRLQREKDEAIQWQNRAKELDQRVKALEWQANNRVAEPMRTDSGHRRENPYSTNTSTSFGMPSSNIGGSNVPTPPEDDFHETDFTQIFRPMGSNDSQMGGTGESDQCGFCTNNDFCLCKNLSPTAEDNSRLSKTAPGTCEACLADPEKARECREIARMAEFRSRPSTSDGPRLYEADRSALTGSVSMPPPPPRNRDSRNPSCWSFIDSFAGSGSERGSVSAELSDLFGGLIRAYPTAAGGAGYEIDDQDAAAVLQSLSRRNTMVSPRESNERGSRSDSDRG